MRTDIVTPPTDTLPSFALSPDGRHIVFVGAADGGCKLWLRSLDSTTAQPLAGTEGATYPFWSPDSRSVGFVTDNQLKRLDLGSGGPRVLAQVRGSRGGSWNRDGVILVAPVARGIHRVSANGGESAPLTALDQQNSHRFPFFLPDGRRFLFLATGGPETSGLYIGSLDSGTATKLTGAAFTSEDSAALYVTSARSAESGDPAGWLLWSREGALVAQRLDLEQQALVGDRVTVAESVHSLGVSACLCSVSQAGAIAYRIGEESERQLTFFDRTGRAQGTIGAPGILVAPRVSPVNPRRVAVSRGSVQRADLWVVDDSSERRFTFNDGLDQWPTWSPDGRRVAFHSSREGTLNLYVKAASGAGVEERLLDVATSPKTGGSWSRDGRFILFNSDADLWVRPMTGGSAPWRFLGTRFSEGWGEFSPDGRWVAYHSDESGRYEIYIRPFVAGDSSGASSTTSGSQWQVSSTGGMYARWRGDGRELYYFRPDGTLMAVPIAARAEIEAGTAIALFRPRVFGEGVDPGLGPQYDVTADGRFLINVKLSEDITPPIVLLQNWQSPR
jgi:Tol biopolymer transport system component